MYITGNSLGRRNMQVGTPGFHESMEAGIINDIEAPHTLSAPTNILNANNVISVSKLLWLAVFPTLTGLPHRSGSYHAVLKWAGSSQGVDVHKPR